MEILKAIVDGILVTIGAVGVVALAYALANGL